MNKKRTAAGMIAVLLCGFASHASAQDAEPKFNSNADDLAKIRGVLEEFRQDIIRKPCHPYRNLAVSESVVQV